MIINDAIDYISELFAGNSDGHGADHTMRVYHNAQMLLEAYPEADSFVASLAALLHDADDHKLFDTENNMNARSFMESKTKSVSVAIKDISEENWKEQVWDKSIVPDDQYLYKRPEYTCD